MTFYDWVVGKYKGKDSMIRDLAGDMEWDRDFPKDGTKADILNYLYSQHACDGCITAFKRAWTAYRKVVRP